LSFGVRMAERVFILNGPNLNLLGQREPEVYGSQSLDDIATACHDRGRELGLEVDFRQSNAETALVEFIHQAIAEKARAIIINAAALTHTSVAIHDALRAFDGIIIEVHLSNTHRREKFRHHSFISPVADGIIMGLGAHGYELALEAVSRMLAAAG